MLLGMKMKKVIKKVNNSLKVKYGDKVLDFSKIAKVKFGDLLLKNTGIDIDVFNTEEKILKELKKRNYHLDLKGKKGFLEYEI